MGTSSIYDTQAEAGIIATLLYNPLFYLQNESLKHGHFYNEELGCIYWAISKLLQKGVDKLDSFNIKAMINSKDGVKRTFEKYNINLDDYIELSKNVSRQTLEEYKILVSRVLALSFKRDLYKKLNKFMQTCLDVEQDDISNISREIYANLNKLNEEYVFNNTEIKLVGDIIDDIYKEIKTDSESTNDIYKTKITSLNNYFDYSPGTLTVWAARFKAGKSAIVTNETLNLLKNDTVVGYLDSEMSTKSFVIRCLANLTQIPVRSIKDNILTREDDKKIREAIKWLKSKKLIHLYDTNWTIDKLISISKILKYKHGINILIHDYIKCTDGINANDTYQKLGNIANTLKNNIAEDLKIPVISLAQLSKSGTLADSDAINRYVSTIIYWEQKKDDEMCGNDWKEIGNYKAQVRVNREGGQMGSDEWIHAVFDGDRMTIYEAPIQPNQD